METVDVLELYALANYLYDIRRMGRFRVPREDMIQEAVIQCWKVIDKFDPARGTKRNFQIRTILNEFHHRIRNWYAKKNRILSLTWPDGSNMDVAEDLRFIESSPGKGNPPDDVVVQILELNAAGVFSAEISRKTGVSESALCRLLKKHGRTAAPQGAKRRIDHDHVIALAKQGIPSERIAARLQVHPNSIRRIVANEKSKASSLPA